MLTEQLGVAAILGGASRLVINLNREEEAPGLLPLASDGHVIPDNHGADREERLDRFWRPYHDRLSGLIADYSTEVLLSLHSFTPALKSRCKEERPWEIGVLYNEDDRMARMAIPMRQAAGMHDGDHLPSSGKLLNATMNRPAEGNGMPYLGIEIRPDVVRREADVGRRSCRESV